MRIKNKKKILLTNYHNKLFIMNDTCDTDLESLFCEWEELELENNYYNNYKRNEAIYIFLIYICYILNNKVIDKSNKVIEKNTIDIDSID
jgi:hypothetical protein